MLLTCNFLGHHEGLFELARLTSDWSFSRGVSAFDQGYFIEITLLDQTF